MKRILGVLVAVAALGAAVASVRGVDVSQAAKARMEAARAASELRVRATSTLDAQLQQLEGKAQAAAALPQIAAILTQLKASDDFRDSQLAHTLKDSLRSEKWWDSYRKTFPVTGVAVEGDKLELALGVDDKEFASDTLVKKARADGQASEIVMGRQNGAGWPFLAVGQRLLLPNRGADASAVLVLARPLDAEVLERVSGLLTAALVLSDGKKAVVEVGPAAEREALRTVIGQEQTSDPVGDAQGTWAAAQRSIAPGFWLWVHASAAASAKEAAHNAGTTKTAIWGGAVLISLVSLFFAMRRSPPAGADAIPPSGTQELGADAAAPGLSGTAMGLGPAPGGTLAPRPTRAPIATPSHTVSGHEATQAFIPGAASPNVFGRYTLVEPLGEGGMAKVFTAVTFGAEGFRRKFVVKRLRPELANETSVVAQFIDEAKLASSFVHSNIIPVFDFGKVGDEYFMATEYILGRDMGRVTRQMLEKERRAMPVDVVLYCAQETLKALDYAHTKVDESGRPLSIVHRDVSPGNVLISARGEVKLFDFGIVKAEGRVTRTEHGVVKGNVSFMSPEQARGVEVDARADLFSLGLVMFYCLTGEVLYTGNTTYELLVKAAGGPGPEELARVRALPAPAAALIEKALAVNPAQRYESAAAFAAAIAPHLRATSADLSALMKRVFGEDFNEEEARFSAAVPATSSGFAPLGGPTPTRATGTQPASPGGTLPGSRRS